MVRHIAEGMVAFLLERHDHAKPIMRSVARELLSSCVLRSIMTFFCPYTVNKAGFTLLLIISTQLTRLQGRVIMLRCALCAACSMCVMS